MSDTSIRVAIPSLSPASDEIVLDAERLAVYGLALQFQTISATILPPRGSAGLRDQMDRASVSIVLNIAEGAGRFSGPDKARFYGIARASAMECAAIVDIARSRGRVSATAARSARGLLVRIVQMLTRLRERVVER